MEVAKIAKRGCGTCKDRKILCDRTAPTCLQCCRSKRRCKGYGLQLSWPRAGDGKRAIVMKQQYSQGMNSVTRMISNAHLIHTHSSDVEIHLYMTASFSSRLDLCIPLQKSPSELHAGYGNLFQYFHHVASQSLTIFCADPAHISIILTRLAFAGNTPSSTAVLRSLLAFSSLHRYGVQGQAMELKIASLKALAAASSGDLSATEAVQHVAAGMLLCSFEVHQASCLSSQWTWYIHGVKELINATSLKTSNLNDELSTLVNWVHYHDVMARFTMRHWVGKFSRLPSNPSNVWPEGIEQVPPGKMGFLVDVYGRASKPSTFKLLGLLCDVCDAVSMRTQYASMTSDEMDDHKSLLQILDWRLRRVSCSTNECPQTGSMVELYRLAILVYLHRASANLLDQSNRVQQYIDRGFELFPQLNSCEKQFPMFMIGCEARTDRERMIVLDLMARTELKVSSRSLNHVKLLVNAVWVQDDLADRELDYWDKLTTIISYCSILPNLA